MANPAGLFFVACLVVSSASVAAGQAPTKNANDAGLLGVSWPAWNVDGYAQPAAHIERLKSMGFRLVALVPTYTHAGLNRIDGSKAPSWSDQAQAVEMLLTQGFGVVYKPHLDAPRYQPGFDTLRGDYDSWRALCGWRGFFDLDPMSPAYLEGVMLPALTMLERALRQAPAATPIRFDLGSELMNSIVDRPERWLQLLRRMRSEIERRGLRGRVLLSHNFSHHFAIPEDEIDRLRPAQRRHLATYVRGLDAIALSQYLDLTVAVPVAERGKRMATPQEIAQALHHHEQYLLKEILQRRLGIAAGDLPTLHLGEFGIGRGGLRHPNLWEPAVQGEAWKRLQNEIAAGHAGLIAYLQQPRQARSAILWVTGFFFDVFGWMRAENAVPAAAEHIQQFLRR